MSTQERQALEALALEWEQRALLREPSVRQIFEECARMLRARIPKGRK